jgi:hypothetical protein
MGSSVPDTLTEINLINYLRNEGAIYQKESRKLRVLDITGYHAIGDQLFTKPKGAMASRIMQLDISIPPERGVLFWDCHSFLSHFPNLKSVQLLEG